MKDYKRIEGDVRNTKEYEGRRRKLNGIKGSTKEHQGMHGNKKGT